MSEYLERRDQLMVKLDNLIREYSDIAGWEVTPDEYVWQIKLLKERGNYTALFKDWIPGKIIYEKYARRFLRMPRKECICWDEDKRTWYTNVAVKIEATKDGEVKQCGTTRVELGHDPVEFHDHFYIYDSDEEFLDDIKEFGTDVMVSF